MLFPHESSEPTIYDHLVEPGACADSLIAVTLCCRTNVVITLLWTPTSIGHCFGEMTFRPSESSLSQDFATQCSVIQGRRGSAH